MSFTHTVKDGHTTHMRPFETIKSQAKSDPSANAVSVAVRPHSRRHVIPGPPGSAAGPPGSGAIISKQSLHQPALPPRSAVSPTRSPPAADAAAAGRSSPSSRASPLRGHREIAVVDTPVQQRPATRSGAFTQPRPTDGGGLVASGQMHVDSHSQGPSSLQHASASPSGSGAIISTLFPSFEFRMDAKLLDLSRQVPQPELIASTAPQFVIREPVVRIVDGVYLPSVAVTSAGGGGGTHRAISATTTNVGSRVVIVPHFCTMLVDTCELQSDRALQYHIFFPADHPQNVAPPSTAISTHSGSGVKAAGGGNAATSTTTSLTVQLFEVPPVVDAHGTLTFVPGPGLLHPTGSANAVNSGGGGNSGAAVNNPSSPSGSVINIPMVIRLADNASLGAVEAATSKRTPHGAASRPRYSSQQGDSKRGAPPVNWSSGGSSGEAAVNSDDPQHGGGAYSVFIRTSEPLSCVLSFASSAASSSSAGGLSTTTSPSSLASPAHGATKNAPLTSSSSKHDGGGSLSVPLNNVHALRDASLMGPEMGYTLILSSSDHGGRAAMSPASVTSVVAGETVASPRLNRPVGAPSVVSLPAHLTLPFHSVLTDLERFRIASLLQERDTFVGEVVPLKEDIDRLLTAAVVDAEFHQQQQQQPLSSPLPPAAASAAADTAPSNQQQHAASYLTSLMRQVQLATQKGPRHHGDAVEKLEKIVRLRAAIAGSVSAATTKSSSPSVSSATEGAIEGYIQSLTMAGAYLKMVGRYADAKEFLAQAVQVAVTSAGPDHLASLRAKAQLGEVEFLLGRYEEAAKLFKNCLVSTEVLFGTQSAASATLLHLHGIAVAATAQLDTAVRDHEAAAAIRAADCEKQGDAVSGPSLFLLAESYASCAAACQKAGDAERGAEFAKLVFELLDDFDTSASSEYTMAAACLRTTSVNARHATLVRPTGGAPLASPPSSPNAIGRGSTAASAERILRQNVTDVGRVIGDESIESAIVKFDLAQQLWSTHGAQLHRILRSEGTTVAKHQSAALAQRVKGETPTTTTTTVTAQGGPNDDANAQRANSSSTNAGPPPVMAAYDSAVEGVEEAKALARESARTLTAHFGLHHPYVCRVQVALAHMDLHTVTHRHVNFRRELLQRCLTARHHLRAALGPDHLDVGIVEEVTGLVALLQGTEAAAEIAMEKFDAAFQVARRNSQLARQQLLLTPITAACSRLDRPLPAVVRPLVEEVVTRVLSTLGETSPELLEPLQNVAALYFLAGDYERAHHALGRALKLADRSNMIFLLGPLFRPAAQLQPNELGERNRIAASRLDLDSARRFAEVLYAIACVFERQGRLDEAQSTLLQVIASLEIAGLAFDLRMCEALRSLGVLLYRDGHYGDAMAYVEKALAMLRERHAAQGDAQRRACADVLRVIDLTLRRSGYSLTRHEGRYRFAVFV